MNWNENEIVLIREGLSFFISVSAGIVLKLAYEWQQKGKLNLKYIVSNVVISFAVCYLLHHFVINSNNLQTYYQPIIGLISFLAATIVEFVYNARKNIIKKFLQKYIKEDEN